MATRTLCNSGQPLAGTGRFHRGGLLWNGARPHPRTGGASPLSYAHIRAKLNAGEVVILDGAIGTELLRRDVTWADHQLEREPNVVRGIHASYIAAGAD